MVKRSVAPPSIGTARGVASHGGATSVHPKCKSASPSRISKHVRGSARSSKETQYVPSQCGLVPGRSPVFCNEATLPWPSYTHNVDVECPSCTPVALSSDRQAVVRGGLGGGGGDGEGCGGGDAPGAVGGAGAGGCSGSGEGGMGTAEGGGGSLRAGGKSARGGANGGSNDAVDDRINAAPSTNCSTCVTCLPSRPSVNMKSPKPISIAPRSLAVHSLRKDGGRSSSTSLSCSGSSSCRFPFSASRRWPTARLDCMGGIPCWRSSSSWPARA